MMLTDDVEFEDVSQRHVGVGDLDAVAGNERLVEAAHDVHLRPLVELLLAPDDRVVEEREVGHGEQAVELKRRVTGRRVMRLGLGLHSNPG